MTRLVRSSIVLAGAAGLALLLPAAASAQTPAAIGISDPQLLRSAVLLTLLALVPAIFISMTSFIRIAVVLAMVRHAFGMPETPPNAGLVSLAGFLTAFGMAPNFALIYAEALQPLLAGSVNVEAAVA